MTVASLVTDVAWLREVTYVPSRSFGGGPTADQGEQVASTATVDLAAFVWISARRKRGEINAISERDYRPRLDDFCRHYGTHKPIAKVRRRHVEKWLESLERLAPSSRRSYYTTVSMWLRWCHAEGLIDTDPTIGIRKPREPRTVPRNLTHDAVAALLGVADQRLRTIALLMVQLGLRRGEVARLCVEDVDLVNRVVRIAGKGDHERVLPIPSQVADELRRHLSAYRIHSGPVIRSHVDEDRGVSPARIGNLMSAALYEAGIKSHGWDRVSGHSLRHTSAADMLRNGAHVRDVQQVLGHQSIATTERYLPLVVNTLAATVDGRRY